jgi:hypothetical protein
MGRNTKAMIRAHGIRLSSDVIPLITSYIGKDAENFNRKILKLDTGQVDFHCATIVAFERHDNSFEFLKRQRQNIDARARILSTAHGSSTPKHGFKVASNESPITQITCERCDYFGSGSKHQLVTL